MLQKLRSRHPVDLPVEGFGRSRGLLGILGFITVAFLLLPLALALYAGLTEGSAPDVSGGAAVAAGIGTLLLVLVVGGLIGKPGHSR